MLERARIVGQFPTRTGGLRRSGARPALAIPPAQAREIVEAAVPRPVTPVYTQLSEILQIQLHRALSRQAEPADGAGPRRHRRCRPCSTAPGWDEAPLPGAEPRGAERREARLAYGMVAPAVGTILLVALFPLDLDRVGVASTCTISGCPGWASPSSGSTTTSRSCGTAVLGRDGAHRLVRRGEREPRAGAGLRARPGDEPHLPRPRPGAGQRS